ncbi:hypothetical protein ACFLWA_12055 [Chloroflexota bacterium]
MPKQAEENAEIRTRRNRVKGRLALTQRLCPGCMTRLNGRGDGHHLFVRRGPDIPELYDPINIILVHNHCHTNEATGMQYRCSISLCAGVICSIISSLVGSLGNITSS